MKKSELRMTFFLTCFAFSFCESSSIETPVIKAKYEGMSGRTQGERNDSRPAESATKSDMFSAPDMA
jgi:hypothetical protein